MGILTAYKCVYVIVQSRQKRKRALLSHRKRRRTHIALLFDFQRLKIGCFKTVVLKNARPCYRCSPSFRNELVVLHLRLSPLHAPWWAAYKDRSHPNDKKVLPETMYFAKMLLCIKLNYLQHRNDFINKMYMFLQKKCFNSIALRAALSRKRCKIPAINNPTAGLL